MMNVQTGGKASSLKMWHGASEERQNELRICKLNCDLAKATTTAIVSGVIDLYFQKMSDKLERAGLIKGKLKHHYNIAVKLLSRLRVAVADIDKNTYHPCTSAILPGFADKYNNFTLSSRIQYNWLQTHKSVVQELYVLRSKVYQHKKSAHPDVLACIDVIAGVISIALHNLDCCEKTLHEQMGVYYRGSSMVVDDILMSLNRNLVSAGNTLVSEKFDNYLVAQVEEAIRRLNDAVVEELSENKMRKIIEFSVFDYFEFYIAYVVQRMQQGLLTMRERKVVIEDLVRLKVDSMFPLRCLKDWKTLAQSLPHIDDIQELQDVITGVDTSVAVPKTPALDRLRRRLMEVREVGF
jgi:hypothetical protein